MGLMAPGAMKTGLLLIILILATTGCEAALEDRAGNLDPVTEVLSSANDGPSDAPR